MGHLTVLAKALAVVPHQDDDGVAAESLVIQGIEGPADGVVHKGDLGVIGRRGILFPVG